MPKTACEPIPLCPAPWNLTGEGWILPLYTPFSTTPIPLPPGSYAPLEQGSTADLSARFHGGIGMVLIVRYAASDAGPYNELMYVPGLFSRGRPGSEGKEAVEYAFAITRIYRADFSFGSSASGVTTLSVSHPSSPSPFFRCALSPSRLTPFAFPIRTSWLTTRFARACTFGYSPALVQPALPGAKNADEQGTGQRPEALVASEKAYVVRPTAAGWARAVCVEPFPADKEGTMAPDWSGFGDRVGFPRFKTYGKRLNVHITGLQMGFPVPEVVDGWE